MGPQVSSCTQTVNWTDLNVNAETIVGPGQLLAVERILSQIEAGR